MNLVTPWHVGSSWIRDPTCVSSIGRWILYHWAIREAPNSIFIGWYILDGITNSMDMSLSRIQDMVKEREAWRAAVHGVPKSWTWLSDWTQLNWELLDPMVVLVSILWGTSIAFFHNGYTNLYFHQPCMKVPFSSQPRQQFFFFFCLFVNSHSDERWYFTVVLMGIFLIISDVEQLFMCLLIICMHPLEQCLLRTSVHFLSCFFMSLNPHRTYRLQVFSPIQ